MPHSVNVVARRQPQRKRVRVSHHGERILRLPQRHHDKAHVVLRISRPEEPDHRKLFSGDGAVESLRNHRNDAADTRLTIFRKRLPHHNVLRVARPEVPAPRKDLRMDVAHRDFRGGIDALYHRARGLRTMRKKSVGVHANAVSRDAPVERNRFHHRLIGNERVIDGTIVPVSLLVHLNMAGVDRHRILDHLVVPPFRKGVLEDDHRAPYEDGQ